MSAKSSDANDLQWTVRVHGQPATEGAPSLVVHGSNLMALVARLLADARVQDIVVRPRIREIRAHVLEPARADTGSRSSGDVGVDQRKGARHS